MAKGWEAPCLKYKVARSRTLNEITGRDWSDLKSNILFLSDACAKAPFTALSGNSICLLARVVVLETCIQTIAIKIVDPLALIGIERKTDFPVVAPLRSSNA